MTPLLQVHAVCKQNGRHIGCADVAFDRHRREVTGIVGARHYGDNRATAPIGIFHDDTARARLCDREIDVSAFSPAPAS